MAKKSRSAPPPAIQTPQFPPLVEHLVSIPVSREELLAAGHHRDSGVLATMSRLDLQELVPQTDGLGMEHDTILMLARFVVERALLVKSGATPERLHEFDNKASDCSTRIFANHAAKQAAKTEVKAQRRATQMPDAQATETTSKKAKKKAKETIPAPAKEKKNTGRKADTSVYEVMVVASSKETREGGFFDKVMKLAKNPIKLETLIGKVAKEAEFRSTKDAETVARVRVRDAYTRLGYLKAAKS